MTSIPSRKGTREFTMKKVSSRTQAPWHRRMAFVVGVAMLSLIGLAGLAGPAGAADGPKVVLNNLHVVDDTGGDPFPATTAGVAACPVDHVPCGLSSPF